MIKRAGIVEANYGGDERSAPVRTNDNALVAAEEFTKRGGIQNVRYVVSDGKSAYESAKIIGEAIGNPDLKWLVFTDEQEKETLMKHSVLQSINVVGLYGSIHSG